METEYKWSISDSLFTILIFLEDNWVNINRMVGESSNILTKTGIPILVGFTSYESYGIHLKKMNSDLFFNIILNEEIKPIFVH
jgi:hypothetical protein